MLLGIGGLLMWILADVAPMAHLRIYPDDFTMEQARTMHDTYTFTGWVLLTFGFVIGLVGIVADLSTWLR